MSPKRLQLSRRKGYRKPEGAVVVSRPGVFGNPWSLQIAQLTPEQAIRNYRAWLEGGELFGSDELRERRARVLARLPELRGKDLLCWCRIGDPCHADILLRIANDTEAGA